MVFIEIENLPGDFKLRVSEGLGEGEAVVDAVVGRCDPRQLGRRGEQVHLSPYLRGGKVTNDFPLCRVVCIGEFDFFASLVISNGESIPFLRFQLLVIVNISNFRLLIVTVLFLFTRFRFHSNCGIFLLHWSYLDK